MTFYNIIYGILFVDAISVVVFSVSSGFSDPLLFWEACVASIIIFIDVVYTSHAIEDLRKPYSVWLKLIDLLNFLILGSALLALNPSALNLFQIEIKWAAHVDRNWATVVFWGLLSAYSVLLFLWNRLSEVHPTEAEFLGQVEEKKALRGKPPLYEYKKELWRIFDLIRRRLWLVFALNTVIVLGVQGIAAWTSFIVLLALIFDLLLSGYIFDFYKETEPYKVRVS